MLSLYRSDIKEILIAFVCLLTFLHRSNLKEYYKINFAANTSTDSIYLQVTAFKNSQNIPPTILRHLWLSKQQQTVVNPYTASMTTAYHCTLKKGKSQIDFVANFIGPENRTQRTLGTKGTVGTLSKYAIRVQREWKAKRGLRNCSLKPNLAD